MTTHRYLGTITDELGWTYWVCACGRHGPAHDTRDALHAFLRHQALSRGRTRRPRPK